MIRLYFIGTVHHDPLCRLEYLHWLREFHVHQPQPPSLVAVEWDPVHFALVKRQRDDLPRLLEDVWPGTPPSITDDLQATLAYEADTHELVYGVLPSETIVWLDQGRQTQANMETFARTKVEIYRDWLPDPRSLPRTRMEALRALQTSFSAQTSNVHATERGYADDVWAYRIAERIHGLEGWGLVVVGAGHTDLRAGMLRQLLVDGGVDCVESVRCSYRQT